MRPQDQVEAAVKARGYHEGYNEKQLLARNVAKLLEETMEFTVGLYLDFDEFKRRHEHAIDKQITDLGSKARKKFDDPTAWENVRLKSDPAAMRKEAADLQVVLFQIASRLEQIDGEPFDIIQAAVEKATADVSRGITRRTEETDELGTERFFTPSGKKRGRKRAPAPSQQTPFRLSS
jgi:hypothetical protein